MHILSGLVGDSLFTLINRCIVPILHQRAAERSAYVDEIFFIAHSRHGQGPRLQDGSDDNRTAQPMIAFPAALHQLAPANRASWHRKD
jgi:hypothetical protein